MNSIPLELFHEIFSRLPTKSIGRFLCVSERWRSILCSADFTELFLTKSSSRPSLLFTIEGARNNEFLFFSSPQIHGESEKSSLAASVQLKLSKNVPLEFYGYASGLFCLRQELISKEGEEDVENEEDEESTVHVICNPSTGQSLFLPKVRTGSYNSFLGFDPIGKVFKVVSSRATYSSCSNVHSILTLGTGEIKWRKIKSPLPQYPSSEGICINGALYYLARGNDATYYIVCFDVRSEKFKFICAEFIDVYATRLINYKGKLCLFSWPRHSHNASMAMWIQEDVETDDWSKHAYTLNGDKFSGIGYSLSNVSVVGVTATGEIVLMKDYFNSNPFYVFYFHPERNTVKRVEVQGFEEFGRVHAIVDHVEDLTFFNMKPHQL